MAQCMQRPDIQKGLRTILMERGLCKNDIGRDGARMLLQSQPDFIEQKEWITERIHKYDNCLVDFYPKYHCEFNYIKMYWCASKKICKTQL